MSEPKEHGSDSLQRGPDPQHGQHGAHDVHDVHDAAHFHNHAKLYLWIGAALMVLTGVTVGVSFIHFGSEEANIVVGLIIAIFKSALVAAIFMHLKEEKGTIYQFMSVTLIMVIVLFALCVLAIKDPILM